MKKILFQSVAIIAISAFITFNASAATQVLSSSVNFITPVSISVNNAPNFGNVGFSTTATYVLSTAGAVTASGAGSAIYSGITPVAGSLKITGSATQGITISTGTYTVSNGVTPSAATCKYNGGAVVTACDAGFAGTAPGANTTLLVGLTIATSSTTVAGSATPGLTVTVNYN